MWTRPSATSAKPQRQEPQRAVLLAWIKQEDDHSKVMSPPAVVTLVVQSGNGTMTEDERRQKHREAGLKGAQTKGKERLREIALKRAQTMGKERLRQAVLKGHAKRSPEERSEAAKKAAATRNRNRAAKKNGGAAPGS
jgi:hypothetical protein